MKKILKIAIIFLLLAVQSQGQTGADCYRTILDASGIPISDSDKKMLQDSACLLKKTFPEAVRDSFMVIDVGFYAYTNDMEGGTSKAMSLIEQILAENPKAKYYLAFGRETSSDKGPNHKVIVKANLPRWGHFKCLTEMERSLFQIRLENELKKTVINDVKAYVKAEREVISKMRSLVTKVVDCCDGSREECTQDCGNLSEFKNILYNDGFDEFNMSFKNINKEFSFSVSSNVVNLSGIKNIQLQESTLDFETEFNLPFGSDVSSKVYLLSNNNICDYHKLKNEFEALQETKYKAIIFTFEDIATKKVSFLIKEKFNIDDLPKISINCYLAKWPKKLQKPIDYDKILSQAIGMYSKQGINNLIPKLIEHKDEKNISLGVHDLWEKMIDYPHKLVNSDTKYLYPGLSVPEKSTTSQIRGSTRQYQFEGDVQAMESYINL